jgi:predicted membrane protein
MKALSLLMVLMLAACVVAQPTQLTYSIGTENTSLTLMTRATHTP